MKLTALLVLGCTCASLANDDGIWPRTPQDLQAEAWARREKGQEQMWSAGMVARIKQALDAGRNPKNLEQCTRQGGGTFPMDPHSGECKRDSALASRAQPAAAPHGAGAGAGAAAHGAARLRVDVFVMAGCPWCALQLAYLKPYLQGMWDLVDFRLWSLVSRRPALDWYMDPEQQKAVAEDSWGGFTSTERYAGFESLNGRADLQGDAWELCAQKYYGRRPPERPWPRYMDFVECMASNYNRVGVGLARECASWAGIDFDGVLDRCARRSSEGRGLLLHSLRAARAARVRSAPTTILGGLRFAAAAAGGRQHAAEAAEVAEERKHARTASVMPDLQSPSRLNSGLCVRLACMLALGDLVPATPSAAEAAKPRAAKYEELGGARDRFIRAAGASGGTAVVVAPPTVRARHLALGADGAAFTFGSWLRSVRGGTLLARFVPGRASSGSGPLPPCANATARPHSWQRAGRAAAGRDDDWDDDDGTPAEAQAPPVPKAMRIDPDLALYVAPDATLWMTVGRGSTAVRLSALQSEPQSEPPHGRVANRCGGGCDDVGGSPQWGLSDAFWRESGRSGACHTTGVGGKPHGSASNSSAPRPACVFPFLANGKWRSSCTRARVAPGQRAGGSGSAHAGHGTGSGVRARAGLVSVEHTLADLFEGARGEGAHPQVGKGVLGKLGFRGAGPATGGAAAAEDEGLVPPPGAAERPAELHAVHGWPWCATQVSAVGAKHGAKKAGAGHVLQWGWCDTGTDTMLLDGRWHHVALACGAARQDCHGAAECSLFVDGAQRARGLLPLRRPGGAGPAPRRRRDTGPPGAVEKRRRRRRHGKGSKAAAKPAKRRARHQRLWAPEQRSRLQFGLSDDNSGWPEWPPARISAVRHPAWNPALSGELSRSRYWRGEALTVAEVLHVVASSSPDATSNARAPELAVPLPAALAKVAAAHGNAARPIDRFGVPMPAAADGGGASAAADAALRARQRDGGLALGTSTGGLHLGREMMDELPRVWQPLLRLFSAMSLLAALLLMVAPPETDDEAGAGGAAEAGAAVAPGEDSWLDAEQIAIMQSQTEVAGEATEGDGIEAGAPGAPGAADGYGTTGDGGDSSNDAVGGNAAAGLAEEMNAYEAEAEVPGGDHIEMEEIGRSTT